MNTFGCYPYYYYYESIGLAEVDFELLLEISFLGLSEPKKMVLDNFCISVPSHEACIF